MKLDVKTASIDALDAVKGKTGRICPLVCDTGFKADGDRCVKVTCRSGYRINDDGECEKVEAKKPVAKREEPRPARAQQERAKAEAAPARPQASGQIICNQQGCRTARSGCRVVVSEGVSVGGAPVPSGQQYEVCH